MSTNRICKVCRSSKRVIKKGCFWRGRSTKSRIQRYYCFTCHHYFSEAFGTLCYQQKKPGAHIPIYQLLVSGVSQRRVARLLSISRITVARKLVRLGAFAKVHHLNSWKNRPLVKTALFDDMETFEHSKCKPVSITVAVEQGSRRIIAAEAVQMPAKGHLAEKSRRIYGYRRDNRPKSLEKVLKQVAKVGLKNMKIKSDQCPRYPKAVRTFVPGSTHIAFKGRRACVVGQGELKAGGFDPLFSLNHTCASFRDNTKRLSRKTWCTTKRIDRLQCLLDLYCCYHNNWIGMAAPLFPPSNWSQNEKTAVAVYPDPRLLMQERPGAAK